MKIRIGILLFVIVIVASACAPSIQHYTCDPTQKKYEAILNTWLNVDINKIVDTWGYPTGSFIAPDGNKVYVYEKMTQARTPVIISTFHSSFNSGFANTNAFAFNNWLSALTSASASGFGASTTTIAGGDIITYSCKTFFEVSSTGTVLKWRLGGNSCVSCTPEENLYLRCDKLFPPTNKDELKSDSTFNSKLKKCVQYVMHPYEGTEAIYTEDDPSTPIGEFTFRTFGKDHCVINNKTCKKEEWNAFVKKIMEE